MTEHERTKHGTAPGRAGASPPAADDMWAIARQVDAPGVRYFEIRPGAAAAYAVHAHDSPGIAVLLGGRVEVTYAAGPRLTGTAATALVLPAGAPHRGRAGAEGARALFLEIATERVDAAGPAARAVLAEPAQWRSSRVGSLGRGIARELALADDASALALEGLTLELLAVLARHRRESERPGAAPAWLRRTREALEDRCGERSLRISELAAVAGVDPAHLARAFRARYGTTPGAYLREARLRRAADALATSSAPLGRVALDAGFADQSHFTRAFRAAHGVTPRRWRALHARS